MTNPAHAAHLYFSEFNGGRIGRANLDGTAKLTLGSDFTNPVGPTLDLVRSQMYWGEAAGANIWRANLDGSGQTNLIRGRNGPGAPALDLSGGRLYWNDSGGGTILRANLDGSDQQVLVRGLNDPHAVVLDLGRGKVYWPEFGAGNIWRANLDGTDAVIIVRALANPALMTLDPVGGKIYWTAHGTGDIRRANLDGSDQEILVRNQNLPAGIALDVGQGHIYWTTYGGADIRRANLDGSGEQILVTGLSGPAFVTLDLLSDGPPAILFSPQAQSAVAGGEAIFSVGAAGAKPMYYHWQHDAAPLSADTLATLTWSNLTFQDAGRYSVVVSNSLGVAESEPATLNVLPLLITSQTGNTNAWLGSNVTFEVVVTSAAPVVSQWRRKDVPITGATNLTLTLTNVQVVHEGEYTVVVQNKFGSLTSQVTRLAILVRPVILQPPLSQSVAVGGNVTFSIEIKGHPPPFTYQWRRGSVILATVVSEERVGFFTVTNVQANQGGLHRVVIANPASPTISGASPNVTWNLTALSDADSDGLPDTWESAYGLDPAVSNLNQNSDDDGSTDEEEYVAGTDPLDSSSYLRIERLEMNGKATIRFQALSNKTYTVLYSHDAGSDSWFKLTDMVARATNRLEQIVDPQAAAWRYYRLVTPRLD